MSGRHSWPDLLERTYTPQERAAFSGCFPAHAAALRLRAAADLVDGFEAAARSVFSRRSASGASVSGPVRPTSPVGPSTNQGPSRCGIRGLRPPGPRARVLRIARSALRFGRPHPLRRRAARRGPCQAEPACGRRVFWPPTAAAGGDAGAPVPLWDGFWSLSEAFREASSRRGCGSCGKPVCRFSKVRRETACRFPRDRQLPQPASGRRARARVRQIKSASSQERPPRTVHKAPHWDLCPGCFAATEAQWEVAPSSASTGTRPSSRRCRQAQSNARGGVT